MNLTSRTLVLNLLIVLTPLGRGSIEAQSSLSNSTNPNVPGSHTFTQSAPTKGQKTALPSTPGQSNSDSGVADAARLFQLTPGASPSLDPNRCFSAPPSAATVSSRTSDAIEGIAKELQIATGLINSEAQQNNISMRLATPDPKTIKTLNGETQSGALTLQTRYLKRLKELSADTDGNGFMDWMDQLKERGEISQETMAELIWEGILSPEEAKKLGISESELKYFEKNCSNKILGI